MEKTSDKANNVITIGCCAYCEKRSKLNAELCLDCYEAFKDFGPNGWKAGFGHIMRQCRKNPKLAKIIYDGLQKESAKEAFASKFGIEV